MPWMAWVFKWIPPNNSINKLRESTSTQLISPFHHESMRLFSKRKQGAWNGETFYEIFHCLQLSLKMDWCMFWTDEVNSIQNTLYCFFSEIHMTRPPFESTFILTIKIHISHSIIHANSNTCFSRNKPRKLLICLSEINEFNRAHIHGAQSQNEALFKNAHDLTHSKWER